MMTARDITFGFLLPQSLPMRDGVTSQGQELIVLARLVAQSGFDALWLFDHFCFEAYADLIDNGFQPPEEQRGMKVGVWECWTTLAALAVVTERVTLGTLVTNTAYRNPALLAHMANTVDHLSGGRLILGLGAGDFQSEHEMHGYPWDRRVGRFEEALQVIGPLLRGETVTFAGEFYETRGAEIVIRGPRPAGPPIMIGAMHGGPRMQRLVAQYADVWTCWMAFSDSRAAAYTEQRDAMYAACERHGRDPATVLQHVTVGVALPGQTWSAPGTPLTGTIQAVAEQLAAFAEHGVTQVCINAAPKTATSVEWLARVIEAVRA